LPTLVATEGDIFRAHGLEVTVNRRHSGKQNLEALRAGETDIALMAPTPLVLDLLKNPHTGEATDPLIIASLVYSSRLNHVVAFRSNDIREPTDLTGGRVGLMAGTHAEFLWWLYTALHGIDPDKVRIIDLPVSSLPEALIEGDIDAAVLWEPWSSRLKARLPDGDVTFLPGSDVYIERWLLVTTRELLAQRPETVRNLLAAYQAAITRLDTDPQASLVLYSEDVGLDTERAIHDPGLPLFGLSLDWALLATLQQTIAWARDSDKPIADTATEILSWIDTGPLQDILPGAVSIPARRTSAGASSL
jgi:ABC-type nitrate/sulfonate/bicarbonate transport system substrate-binding protein